MLHTHTHVHVTRSHQPVCADNDDDSDEESEKCVPGNQTAVFSFSHVHEHNKLQGSLDNSENQDNDEDRC